MTVRLILTHHTPDLDAIGMVYSAHKAFGQDVVVECRYPSPEELRDPAVVVGDIGLPGCEEIGHSPTLNNYDHHFSCAERSATWLFNDAHPVLRPDIVAYVDVVDTQGGIEGADATLKVAVAGIRVRHDGADREILAHGERLLSWLDHGEHTPGDLSRNVPDWVQGFLRVGQNELTRIRQELAVMQMYTTDKGRSIGYLVIASPVFSIVKEEAFAQGIDIAVVYSPARQRYSIASNAYGPKQIDLKEVGLIDALNTIEWSRGLPGDQSWGGHRDRIGSPRPAGSCLTSDEILHMVKSAL